MLEHLSAVLHLPSGDAPPEPVFGALPAEVTVAALLAMRGGKPSARKEGGKLVIVVPVAEAWRAWVFDHVPPVTELAGLIERVEGLTRAMPSSAAPAAEKLRAVPVLLERFARAGRLRRKGVLQSLVDGIAETEAARAAIAFPVGRRRLGRMTYSDRTLAPRGDELRALARQARAAGTSPLIARAGDLEEDALDAALLAKAFEADTVAIDLPPLNAKGYGLALIDPAPGAEAEMGALRDMVSLSLRDRTKAPAPMALRFRRMAALAGFAALVAYLAWPAPRVVTATGLSQPAEAVSVALHFDAFLAGMRVAVGQEVAEGDLLADFLAPDLEERRSETALQIAVEEVAAQSALAQNDYGAFVLAEQRIAAQQRRLDNLEARLERLGLRAPVSGTVVDAMGRGTSGAFIPTGQQVALIQEDARFALTLNVLRVDAPMISEGQRGEVYFRGISGESFDFRVTTPVMIERNPDTGEERLTARAVIETEDQSRLLAGLSGYARLEAGTAPRGLSFARYAIEYVKVKAWTLLGLRW